MFSLPGPRLSSALAVIKSSDRAKSPFSGAVNGMEAPMIDRLNARIAREFIDEQPLERLPAAATAPLRQPGSRPGKAPAHPSMRAASSFRKVHGVRLVLCFGGIAEPGQGATISLCSASIVTDLALSLCRR
jgi:hypothetical protein